MFAKLKTFWARYGHWLMMLVPILGFWIGRRSAAVPQAASRGAAAKVRRDAAGAKARVRAETTAAATAARVSAAKDAAGDDTAVVDALNKRRGRK